jgi:ribosomal protein S18 acetylase RimI-like enzyme
VELTVKQLNTERFGELNGLFDMSPYLDYAQKRLENLTSGRELCLIAELEGKLTGEINIMFENENVPEAVIPNRRAYIFALRVKEWARGVGIGKILVAEAVDACVSRGYSEQTVGVEPNNKPALRIYESAGFKPFIGNMREKSPDGGEYAFDLLLRTGFRARQPAPEVSPPVNPPSSF